MGTTKKKEFAFVQIVPTEPGWVNVTYGYKVFTKTEKSGMLSCVIPGFGIRFIAKDENQKKEKAEAFMTMFFDHFFLHNKTTSLKKLSLQLHRLSFIAQKDAMVMKSLVRQQAVPAKFKIIQLVPDEYKGSQSEQFEGKINRDVAA